MTDRAPRATEADRFETEESAADRAEYDAQVARAQGGRPWDSWQSDPWVANYRADLT